MYNIYNRVDRASATANERVRNVIILRGERKSISYFIFYELTILSTVCFVQPIRLNAGLTTVS